MAPSWQHLYPESSLHGPHGCHHPALGSPTPTHRLAHPPTARRPAHHQVLANQRYSSKADVYSFGVVVWECCARTVPYEGMNGVQAAMAVVNRWVPGGRLAMGFAAWHVLRLDHARAAREPSATCPVLQAEHRSRRLPHSHPSP